MSNRLRKVVVNLAVIVVAVVMGKSIAMAQSREFRKTVEFTGGGNLRVHSDRGSVRLSGWAQNQIEVYALISRPTGDRDFDPRSIELTQIEVLGDSSSLTIRANYDAIPGKDGNWGNRSIPEVHFEIRAPRNLNLRLEADRSKTELNGIEGRIELNTDRGNVSAENLVGEIRLRMDRGSAVMSGLRAKLDVRTDRGNATLNAAEITGDSYFETDRGDIELRVPRSQGLYISANRNRRTGFESDFAIATRTFSDDKVEGEINGGGPRVTIKSDRGKARLKQQ